MKYIVSFFSLLAVVLACACAKDNPSRELVKSFKVKNLDRKASVAPDKTSSRSIAVTAVLDKNSILNQDYFYNANLQYSSIYDKKDDLYTQSIATGLVPVHFRIAGGELDLIADNRNQYPSDVNHPEALISRYQIVSQTDTTITISEANSANYLSTLVGEATTGASASPAPEDHWVRSFEYAAQGQYILQESSIQLQSGEIIEFMESVFPVENMKASSSFKVYQMDPDDPVGAKDGPVSRYRFLASDKVYSGESKMSYAEHFDLADNQSTIDWYVTPNITDEDLVPVSLAVDGWNRYFRNFKAINRDVMKFKGRLPNGIHLGDPRYNVINWDSRLVAGAAYESQSFDPSNGKQANSIIYMPAAWIKIGMDYWANGEFSDIGVAQAIAQSSTSKLKSVCFRDMHEAAAYLASGKIKVSSESALKKFGTELLKQTLFHELGHALGLAHNFKGSLSYRLYDTKSKFSTSIMDYNDFEIERAAFDDVDSSNGPLLEYDRQALSSLYNNGADIATSDEFLPACNDSEADNETGGIDPLCSRYDIEHDPTQSIADSLARINQVHIDGDVTLTEAIAQVPSTILNVDQIAQVKSKDDLDHLVTKISNAYDGVLSYYLNTGRASLGYATRINLKALYKFGATALPSEYDPRLMRERVFTGVSQILNLKALPDSISSTLNASMAKSIELLKLSPYLAELSINDQNSVVSDKQKQMSAHMNNFTKDEKLGLVALRAKTLTAMARHPSVPFFFGKFDQTQVDYEMLVVGLLGDSVTAKDRSATERLAAAKSLASFSSRKIGDEAISKANSLVGAERDQASDSDSRDLAEALLKALSGGAENSNLK